MLLDAVNYLLGHEDMTIEQIRKFPAAWDAPPRTLPWATVMRRVSKPRPARSARASPTAVGMALAERLQAARFGDKIVDHHTYVLASDGDLMEGVSHEAIGLAGHLKLSKLIVLYDDNGITIDGALSLSESSDALKRFEAAGWNASRIDGHNPDEIAAAIEKARKSDRPDADRLPHSDRLWRTQQAGQAVRARLTARRR